MKSIFLVFTFATSLVLAQVTGDGPATDPNESLPDNPVIESEDTHEALAPAPKASAVKIQKEDPNLKLTVKDAPKKEEHHEVATSVSAEQSATFLKNGNTRFRKGYFRKDGASRADVKRLSTDQHPHAIILSCSDSRVPPEVVFDQKLGEIFTVRTAGEVLDPGSIASIEYAIEHLGSKLIVVMGHTQCGAVKAAMGTFGGKSAGSENLDKLVADIHPRIKKFENKTPSKNFESEGWANVSGVAKDLITRSEIIAAKINSGDIQIKEALYHLENGLVVWH